jgi:eukaryotic-like serine/threonine-protein kinase
VAAPIAERPGSKIGNYKLLEQIGEGGFGLVFVAEQERPVRRRVALKIIKPGMDTREVVARFEAERQALALMDHPNIARVIDGGTTESGRPYFVMELVRGIPITDYCDQHHLGPRERLELFVSVCQAVQHAHQKGIIHRDIKPSNVLVMLQDGKPLVKVIDFGIAKALYQPLTEKTIVTKLAQMIGTPLYMSPEQAEMGGLDIDTRSDVYSLGVLLYELLTGTTPFDKKRLARAAYEEFLRIVLNEEPPRPSTRLSSLGDTATAVAVNRGLDVKRLLQILAGDIGWVVMKALEKDRGRRYDTATSFAEDIQRYLRDEAIVARPPSKAYQFRKFVRRNRGGVVTTGVVAVALLTGAALAAWQAVRATRAEGRALAAEKTALSSAEDARRSEAAAVTAARAEKQAKEDALAREKETKAVLNFVEDRIFSAARPEGRQGGLGREVSLRKAIESALVYVDQSFPGQPLIEASVRLTLGHSFKLLGDAPAAVAQEQAARALYSRYRGSEHPDTLLAMEALASADIDLGQWADALRLNEQVLAGRKTSLGPDNPLTLRAMANLAHSYALTGHLKESLQLFQETAALTEAKLGKDDPQTLDCMARQAHTIQLTGRTREALKIWEEVAARRKATLGVDHPDTLSTLHSISECYYFLGRYDASLKLREETLKLQTAKLGPEHLETLSTMAELANSYDAVGRFAEARQLREKTLALQQVKLGKDHPNTLKTMFGLAENAIALGRPAEALAIRQQAFNLAKAKLGPDHVDTLSNMAGMAKDLVAVGRDEEALKAADECLQRSAGKAFESRLRPMLLEVRLRHFRKIKDGPGCRQCAEMLEKSPCTDAAAMYYAACFRAVAADAFRAGNKAKAASREADREADRAMAWLKQSIAAGLEDAAFIKEDKDLTSLQSRDDFKKLVAEIDAKKPKAH